MIVIRDKEDNDEYRYLRLNLTNYLKGGKIQKFEDLIMRTDKFIITNSVSKFARKRKFKRIYKLREDVILKNNKEQDDK